MIHELLAATLAFEPPWQVPPPPPSSPRIADVVRTLDEVLFPAADAASDDPRLPRTRRVILQGPWGSGRRSGALTLAAQVRSRHPGGGFLVVASELRGSGAQRRLCNAYGQRLPTSLAGPALAQAYRDVLRPHAGLLIIDARHGVDGDALDALLPPDTWTCNVLRPERARVLPALPRISLGGSIAVDASAGLDDDSDAAKLAQAARLFDPAAGAKRSILVRIADVAPEHGGAAVDALVDCGVLIALTHDRRVAAARGSSGLIAPAIARRFVATYGELGTMVATAATADERAHARTIVAQLI